MIYILTLLLVSVISLGCKKDSDNINASEKSSELVQSQDDTGDQTAAETYDEEAEKAITPTITSAEVKTLMEEDSGLIIIDLRALDNFKQGHISGAVQINLDDLKGLVAQGLRDKKVAIIIYSNSRITSQKAVEILTALEFTNVKNLGSIKDWEYDLVKGAD